MDTKRMVLVSTLCGLGYMMYSVDRMVMSSSVGLIAKEFGLSKTQSGLLLSSFFYGFIALLFIGGILSDKLSGKPVLILGLVMFSVFTGMTGLTAGLTSMLIYRVMTGVGEGIFWPAASLEVTNVTTEKQRTTVMSLYWAGYPIGGFLGTWLGAIIGPIYGWRAVFFVACGLGLLISLIYWLIVKPNTSNETAYNKMEPEKKLPVSVIFKYPSVILLSIYYLVLLSGWWILLLWAPTFLMNTKHMSLSVGGTIASLLGISGAIGGYILGRYCDKGSLSRKKTVLLWITILSGILMAVLVLQIPTWLTVVLILLLGFFGYPITPVVLAITSQLVPKPVIGSATGFVMNVGMVAGGVSPVLAGALSDKYGMSSVWFIAGIVMVFSCLLLFFKAQPHHADLPKQSGQENVVL